MYESCNRFCTVFVTHCDFTSTGIAYSSLMCCFGEEVFMDAVGYFRVWSNLSLLVTDH